ncbi:MAG: hypothetical protein H6922_05460 [Pseudomonadaceae bacterium]|nr:hypothetical protein [Pseudomonadaceae bacterium]
MKTRATTALAAAALLWPAAPQPSRAALPPIALEEVSPLWEDEKTCEFTSQQLGQMNRLLALTQEVGRIYTETHGMADYWEIQGPVFARLVREAASRGYYVNELRETLVTLNHAILNGQPFAEPGQKWDAVSYQLLAASSAYPRDAIALFGHLQHGAVTMLAHLRTNRDLGAQENAWLQEVRKTLWKGYLEVSGEITASCRAPLPVTDSFLGR